MLSEEDWQSYQVAALGVVVTWLDRCGRSQRGRIVMAPNDAEALEVCETDFEDLHDMILVRCDDGALVWVEDDILIRLP